jgi:hypothetical protein
MHGLHKRLQIRTLFFILQSICSTAIKAELESRLCYYIFGFFALFPTNVSIGEVYCTLLQAN